MKRETEMRREYDFSKGERGKFYGKVAGVRVVFHRLWSKAEGQEGYEKSEWTKLGKLLNKNNIPV